MIDIGNTQPVKLTFLSNGLYLCQLTSNHQLFMVNLELTADKIFTDARL